MVEKYKHNTFNILIMKILFILDKKIQMSILLSPLHNYYLKLRQHEGYCMSVKKLRLTKFCTH